MTCEFCGKKTVLGRKVAHDRMYINGKSSRLVKPNLHTITLFVNGVKQKKKACTRCMRTMRKINTPRT